MLKYFINSNFILFVFRAATHDNDASFTNKKRLSLNLVVRLC